jgi:GT2 family glycosyltransferase
MNLSSSSIGVIAIGRNEGERLRRCLASLPADLAAVVYVDSGSDDGSVALARDHGAQVIELDPQKPFSAARARNVGVAELKRMSADVDYVQFIDGDCELASNWLASAQAALTEASDLAVVCGRRREIEREASIYNRLCDLEWDTPIGDAKACGGDALMRIDAFDQVGGFDESVVAGEEPELCFRLRQAGWQIRRLDADMAYHDADMHRFSQWWQRVKRAGHAVAQGMAMHGRSEEHYAVKTSLSIWLWGLGIPLLILAATLLIGWYGLLVLLVYPLQVIRIAIKQRSRGWSWFDCFLYATACVISKFPQLQGQCRFWWNGLRRRKATLIEYKQPSRKPSG